MKVLTKANNKNKSAIAINEVSIIETESSNLCLCKFSVRKKMFNKKTNFRWSTNINPSWKYGVQFINVNGPILSLNSKKIAITPISPFRPRRWKGKILSDSSSSN